MDRRTALRALAAASFTSWMTPHEVAALLDARRAIGCSEPTTPPLTLSEREIAVVRRVADVILPRTDSPSASDVGVDGFIDIVVSEWFDEPEADTFRAGLSDLDARAIARAGVDFLATSDFEREEIVHELDEALAAARERTDFDADSDFFHWMKRLTLTGYFTSEEGMALTDTRIVPGRFEGCVTPGGSR